MRYLPILFLLAMLSVAAAFQIPAAQIPSFETSEQRFEQFGPRADNLQITIYNGDENRLQQDLETGAVDIMDTDLPQTVIDKWSQAPYNETIAMEKYPTTSMFSLEINNNETIPDRNWRSPTSYAEFRHAIAHLVDKERIINEILKGYGMEMHTPVMPWSEWLKDGVDTHPYDPVEAAAIFDAAGFVQGTTPNPHYNSSKPGSAEFIRVYPLGHEKAGQDLESLIFCIRYDDLNRKAAGYLIQDELLNMGIPVTVAGPIRIEELERSVWIYKRYHLYTGGWYLLEEPEYLYYLYHSKFYEGTTYSTNLNNVHDDELDHWLENLSTAPTKDAAMSACREAQQRLTEIVGLVPLWCPIKVNAYRKYSERAPAGWTGIVNQKDCGVDSWWTFLNMHSNDSEQGGTINYGAYYYIESLSPINFGWAAEAEILTEVYDSLLTRNPYAFSVMPSLAESFEVGTWFNQETSMNSTKLTFNLHDDVYWHDGIPFTSEDVKFTIEYLLGFNSSGTPQPSIPSQFYLLSNVESVEAPDAYTVVVYMDEQSYWTIYDIGQLLIIPKHVWYYISKQDALGAMPDPQLVGTGPFKLVTYVPESYCLLEANTNYFKYCPVQVEVDYVSRLVKLRESISFDVTVSNYFADKAVTANIVIFFDNTPIENRTVNLEPNSTLLLGHYSSKPLVYGPHELEITHTADPYTERTCTYHAELMVDCKGGGAGGRPPLAT